MCAWYWPEWLCLCPCRSSWLPQRQVWVTASYTRTNPITAHLTECVPFWCLFVFSNLSFFFLLIILFGVHHILVSGYVETFWVSAVGWEFSSVVIGGIRLIIMRFNELFFSIIQILLWLDVVGLLILTLYTTIS